MRPEQRLFITVCVVLALVAVATAASTATSSGVSPVSASRDTGISAVAPGITLRPVPGVTAVHVIVTAAPLPAGTAIVTGISPASADRGSTITAVVSGSGFKTGTTVRIISGRTIITATGVTVPSDSQVRCTLAIPEAAPLGAYTVSALVPGQPGAILAGAFEVTAPAPTATATPTATRTPRPTPTATTTRTPGPAATTTATPVASPTASTAPPPQSTPAPIMSAQATLTPVPAVSAETTLTPVLTSTIAAVSSSAPAGAVLPLTTPLPTPTPVATETPAQDVSPSSTTTATAGTPSARAAALATAGEQAWNRAWGASDTGEIRRHLGEMKAAYADSLEAANGSDDPDLTRLRSTATAYIALADGALAMYDGGDVFERGRAQMAGGDYLSAADAFGSAADEFAASQSHLGNATDGLEGLASAGPADTAAILSLLKGKAAYVGECSELAEGWEHTAHAFRERELGVDTYVRNEVMMAAKQFAGLQLSPAFGADASANLGVFAATVEMTNDLPVLKPLDAPAPGSLTLSGVSPTSLELGRDFTLEITGTGFKPGARVALLRPLQGGYIGISGNIGIITVTSTSTASTIKWNGILPACENYVGVYDVYVQNPDSYEYSTDWAVLPGAVSIHAGDLSMVPGSVKPGETVTVRVSSNFWAFPSGTQVKLVGTDGQTIEATGETLLQGMGPDGYPVIECTLAIPPDPGSRVYTLWVQLPGEEWIGGQFEFHVLDGPTITGFNWPMNCMKRNSTGSVILNGVNFEPGVQVRLTKTEDIRVKRISPSYIEADDETLLDGRIHMSLTIPFSAEIGWYDAEVRNPGMSTWNRKRECFAVSPSPEVFSIQPNVMMAGDTAGVIINGRDFISSSGQLVSLAGPGYSDIIYAKYVHSESPGRVSCTFEIPEDTPPGVATLRVSNNFNYWDGWTTSGATGIFQVTPAYTTVTAVTPASVLPGNSWSLRIDGINFKPGAEVLIFDDDMGHVPVLGIQVRDVQYDSSKVLRCTVEVKAWAGPYITEEFYSVAVRNPGDSWGIELEDGFSVRPF